MKNLSHGININHRGSILVLLFLLSYTTAFSQLKADFSASPTSGCAPLIVQFKDSSTGNPISWTWDLGDGTVVNKHNPGIIYFNPGTYTIKLTVKDAAGNTSSITKTAFITAAAKPSIEFSASPISGCAPLTVNFADESNPMSGSIQSWFWDFGDGTFDTIKNPSHTYKLADSFNVTLIITNSFGCSESLLKTSYVAVADTVQADFLYAYKSICDTPATFQFTDLSKSSTALTYQWSFGDGGTSNQKSPSHTYLSYGDYDIKLIATNQGGCADTIIKSISIGTQVANFVLPPTGCINESVFMQDTSMPVPLDSRWTFGDGKSGTGLSTSHVYTTAGEYHVTYTANFGGCIDSAQKTINIVNKPVASFNSPSVRTACSAPLTIQFVNTSTGATTYLWDFGDSTTSTESNPTHTYTASGVFDVRLVASNGAGGCGDTIIQTQFVKISPPDIKDFLNLPYTGCVLAPVTFKADIDTSEPIKSYLWDFGDGNTSTNATPVHVYNAPGTYTIKLTITSNGGCTDTLSKVAAVTVNNAPKANFKASPLNACASQAIQFTDISTGGVTGWKWLFGDGTVSATQNPLHQYKDTGFFTITLWVSNGGCTDTLSQRNYIHINGPVAEFSDQFDCSNEMLHRFSDSSIGAQNWHWDFDDGSTSTIQNPSPHLYATPGVYYVKLIVNNGSCADTMTHIVYALNDKPTFKDTALHSNFCKSDSIKFTATGFDPAYVSNFLWNFGDGNVSSGPADNPVIHKYQQAGDYIPFLVITDFNGCQHTTDTNVVSTKIYGPTAFFNNTPGTCQDSSIIFTDSSFGTHPLQKWVWKYGDGEMDTLTTSSPFSHNYTTPGTYNVKLIVYDANGCIDSLLKTSAVTITNPVANFSVLSPFRCTSSEVTFTNTSTGGSTFTYFWNFGDGDSSILSSPTHLYTREGIYSVSLKITDRFGCTDTTDTTSVITISNPKASFAISDSLAACPPLLVQTQNTSLNYTESFWAFGDGNTSTEDSPFHSYTLGGTYTLMLIEHGFGECYDTASKIINVRGPSGTFKYSPLSGCYPQQISFEATTQNTSLYIWDFGDGSIETIRGNTISHQYDTPGIYTPRVILQDTAGCKVPLQITDSIRISGAFPGFAFNAQTGCDSSLVTFNDSSIATNFDKVNIRTWDFGDSTFSSDVNPLHYYKKPGTYRASLFIQTDSGCKGNYVLPVTVEINKSPVIAVNFLDSVCVNIPINFTATDNANITDSLQWFWNFGNNETSNTQNPVYAYTTAGIFNVSTIAKATTGCADTVQKNVAILPLPSVKAGIDTFLCLGQSLLLQPSGALSFEWQTSPTLSCATCNTPLAVPDTTTTYYVTGTDMFGCKAQDSITISVIQLTHLTVPVTNDTLCIGSSVQLNASGAEQYNWQPVTGLSSSTISNPVASPPTSTVYTVIGSDNKKCFADTAQVSILVAPLPTFNIIDSAVTLNVGSTFPIKTTNSPNVTGWAWLPPYGLSCADCGEPVAQPKANVTYTAQAITAFGCVASDNIVFNVVCNNSNIFIPNTFSPNGDSKNDYFYPQGKGLFTIKSLRIFNRWGVMIFAKTNFGANIASNGWDGKYNGVDQQPDVYVYIMDVLCENGSVLSYKGNVTLIR